MEQKRKRISARARQLEAHRNLLASIQPKLLEILDEMGVNELWHHMKPAERIARAERLLQEAKHHRATGPDDWRAGYMLESALQLLMAYAGTYLPPVWSTGEEVPVGEERLTSRPDPTTVVVKQTIAERASEEVEHELAS